MRLFYFDFCFTFRQLGYNYRGEHYDGAYDLACRRKLDEHNYTRQHREYGFEAHKQRCYRRLGVFLTDYLKSVRDAAGKDACVNDREPHLKNFTKGYILENKRKN